MWTAVRTLVSCFIYKFLLNSVPHTPRVYVAWGGSYCTYFCVCFALLSSAQLGFGDITFKWLSTCAELIWCFQIIVYWPKKYKEFPYLCFCIRFTFIHISTIFVWKFSKKNKFEFSLHFWWTPALSETLYNILSCGRCKTHRIHSISCPFMCNTQKTTGIHWGS